MDNTQEMLKVLDEVLSLNGRTKHFKSDTPLLGGIPELDSMAVVGVITRRVYQTPLPKLGCGHP